MQLSDVQKRFILHWGEMGTRWGITRSMAQIQALLYISPQPLHAEEIAATLAVARSNVSTSLRELQGWGIVKVVHVFGDRRDHFETEKDVWALFHRILDERKRREIEPTVATLKACLADGGESGEVRQRIADMLEFFELTSRWYETVGALPKGVLVKLAKLGDKVPKKLGLTP